VLDALAACGGSVESAQLFAVGLGFKNRHQLARLLEREGLPVLEELAAWARLLDWRLQWERNQTGLCRLAIVSGLEPAVCYRTVKRLTGLPWTTVRDRSIEWTMTQLRARCRIPQEVGLPSKFAS